MTNQIIDNSLKNLGKTVLWQYDKAVRLLAILKHMQVLYHCAVEQFWDWWRQKVLSIETCGALGCSIWGMLIGIPRPTVKDAKGNSHLVATSVYRRILKGAFYLMKSSSSFQDLQGYLEIVFGVGGNDSLSKWTAKVSEFGWTTNVDEINGLYEAGVAYPAGYVFWYDPQNDGQGSNWKVSEYIPSEVNTDFEAIREMVKVTYDATTYSAQNETILLKLIDPEGIVRSIGGSPKNSLTVTTSYDFGETTITATATRRRKCGVSISDNEDMTMEYGKTVFFEQMHSDQRALYEQRLEELCPYPLGVGDGRIVEEWAFGFSEPTYKGKQWRELGDQVFTKGEAFRATVDGKDQIWVAKQTVQKNTPPSEESLKYLADKVGLVTDTRDQDNTLYEPHVAYSAGDVFGYVDGDGHGFNYKVKENISASQNKSFQSISDLVEKTREAIPFLGALVDESTAVSPHYFTYIYVFRSPWYEEDKTGWSDIFKGYSRPADVSLPYVLYFSEGDMVIGKYGGMKVIYRVHAPKVSSWTQGGGELSLQTNDYCVMKNGGLYMPSLPVWLLFTKEVARAPYYRGSVKLGTNHLPSGEWFSLFRYQEALDDLTENHLDILGWEIVAHVDGNLTNLIPTSTANFLSPSSRAILEV